MKRIHFWLLLIVCMATFMVSCGDANSGANSNSSSLSDPSSLTLTAAPNTDMAMLYNKVFVRANSIHVLDFKDEEQQTHTLSASFSSKSTLKGNAYVETYTLAYHLDANQGNLDIKAGDDLIVIKNGKTCHIANIGMVSGSTTSIYPYPDPVWK